MTIVRPLKLTPELIEEIAEMVEIGHFPASVVAKCGISYDSYVGWFDDGALPNAKPILRMFHDRIVKALATAEQNHLARWLKVGERDWRASEAFLVRRFPERWGPRGETTHKFQKLQLEEQLLRVEKLRAEIAAIKGGEEEPENPAYVEALDRAADEVWGPEGSGD